MTPPGSSSILHDLNLCATSQDLTTDGIPQSCSTNPDRRFLLLKDSFRRLKLLSQNLSSDTCTLHLLSELSSTQNSWALYHDITRVLCLLSFATLILSEELVRTPCTQSFNKFLSVESFQLCALPAAAVVNLLSQVDN
jgi:hypothetical protein